MRLDKLLSNLKYGSRKEIKEIVKEGFVTVNGNPVYNSSVKINPEKDEIFIYDEKVEYFSEINIAMYKPIDYISANYDNYYMTAIDLLVEPYSRYEYAIAGRLDLDSEGLLILTTNGQFAHQIMSPNSNIEKTYEVILDKDIVETDLNKLLKGFNLNDGRKEYFAVAKKAYIEDEKVYITITEGKFHQVKNMFSYIGYEVVNLKRVQIGKLKLGNLEPGEFFLFDKEELL